MWSFFWWKSLFSVWEQSVHGVELTVIAGFFQCTISGTSAVQWVLEIWDSLWNLVCLCCKLFVFLLELEANIKGPLKWNFYKIGQFILDLGNKTILAPLTRLLRSFRTFHIAFSSLLLLLLFYSLIEVQKLLRLMENRNTHGNWQTSSANADCVIWSKAMLPIHSVLPKHKNVSTK